MGKFKDKVYNYFVKKNWGVNLEYEPHIDANPQKYKKCRLRRLWLLFKLNMHYRVFRKKTPMLKETVDRLVNNARMGVVQNSLPKPAAPVKPKPAAKPAPKPDIKLPYLDGSESEAHKRLESVKFVQGKLITFDVISFDIFDTLILRAFAKPTDLFMVVGNKLNLVNFTKLRIETEKELRNKNEVLYGNREITIYEIYEQIARRTGIDAEVGVKTEFETEKEFCFANPYMMQVFKILKNQGKEIIITSDMYLPHDMMAELLSHCGYEGYSKLYVSCDYSCSKRSGGLYKNIINEYQGKTIVHVGDNFAADIEAAKNAGIEGVVYRNCHIIGNQFRAEGMSEHIGSLYAGIVNTHLHNGTKTYNPYYEYGFIYGGLYVTGYCNWIYKRAKEQGVEKILFLSRDGDIYQKVFNKMFDDMPNEYVYWSRIANFKYTIEHCKNDFLTRIVTHKAYNVVPCTFKDILESFELGGLVSKLKKYNLKENSLLTPELIKTFENFIIENYDEIIETYRHETEIVEQKFKKIIGKCKKVAVVDVGWLGTGPLGIKWLIEEKWNMGCEVKCYLAASSYPISTINLNELTKEITETYMFNRIYNRDLFDTHLKTNKNTNCIYFEMMSQANYPSFSGYKTNGDYVFDVPEVKNYMITNEIQRGILEFNKLYMKFTEANPYLRNISGYDAYLPYRFVIKNPKLIKLLFKDATFSRNVGINLKTQAQETIGDILNGVKV